MVTENRYTVLKMVVLMTKIVGLLRFLGGTRSTCCLVLGNVEKDEKKFSRRNNSILISLWNSFV